VTLHAITAFQGHFTMTVESSTGSGTVSVNCSVYCRANDDWNRKVFKSRRHVSSDDASQTAGPRGLFNAHFSHSSALTQKPKVLAELQ